jgi:uncharacterized protein (TIRG00374 family)
MRRANGPGHTWLDVLKRWQPLLRGVGLGLLVWLLLRIDPRQLLGTWMQADKALILLATVLAFPMMFIKVERWRYLLKALGIAYPLTDAATAYFGTYYIGVVTPGRAGEILKALYIHENNVSIGTAMVSVILDRTLDLLVLVGLALLGIWLVPQFAPLGSLWFWGMLIGLGAVGGVLLLRTRILESSWHWLGRRLSLVRYLDGSHNQASDFLVGLRQVATVPTLFVALLLSVGSWLVVLLECYLIARSLSIAAPFWYLAFAVAAAGMAALLPVSIAGIGVRDTVLVAVLGLIGVAPQKALAFSLLYFAIFGMALGMVGAVFWYRRPISRQGAK